MTKKRVLLRFSWKYWPKREIDWGEKEGVLAMEFTEEHYKQLLGLPDPWEVESVQLSIKDLQVDVHLSYGGEDAPCPECQKKCSIYDHQRERTWRHLDTMQFTTLIHCATPRVNCPEHGVRNVEVPWAGKHSRFTLLFEGFAVSILMVSESTKKAQELLRLNWKQVNEIMHRAVKRGLQRREEEEISWLGIDEKSFRKGQSFISVLTDIDGRRIIDVVEDKTEEACKMLLKQGLSDHQREMVCGAAMDMAEAFVKAAKEMLPHADVVHDHYHISQHINDAIDKVRCQEHAILLKRKDKTLTGSKYLWLKGFENLSSEEQENFKRLRYSSLKIAKAWHLKELFRHFWTLYSASSAAKFFKRWYQEAVKSGLKPMQKVARMLKEHLEDILTYFNSFITNAISEGFNSKIQLIRAKARGFRSFENYRVAILFHCGKLDLFPR